MTASREPVCTPEWLSRQASLHPDDVALVADTGEWTWRQLDEIAGSVALRLSDEGVRSSEHVALLARNGPEFIFAVHGLIRLGAVLVPLNHRLSVEELAYQLRDSRARLLVHDEEMRAATLEAASAAGTPSVPLGALLGAPSPHEHTSVPRSLRLDRTQSVIYTSGTTGRPKGAMITYGNHWWSAVGSALNLGTRHDDVWLACLPLFHVGGLTILMRSAICGAAVIVHRRFEPAAVNAAIDTQRVSLVSVVSVMLQRMLDERGDRPYPPTLRCVLLGGGPAPRRLLERCASLGVPVLQTYGLTETCSQAATLAPRDSLRKLGSAGKPLLPVEICIAAAGGPARPGEPGEILVRGPNVVPGYLGRPEETARTFRDGWLHTGDVGYLDEEGYLYVLDRRDDLIVSGGENVYPAEVESVLCSHPAVAEAAVIGAPDERWGQRVVAVVVPARGRSASAEELTALCRSRLAGYKVPKEIRFASSLPRNAAGKLLRRELRADAPESP